MKTKRNIGTLSAILNVVLLALAWLALSPTARASCQDGCLTNGNTRLGDEALVNVIVTDGLDNTAVGAAALYNNTTGAFNIAIGSEALGANIDGVSNTATGVLALFNNTSGSYNTASGDSALYSNTTGVSNTATGFFALYYNTTGFANTASGFEALFENTYGGSNTASGDSALPDNTIGYSNTATGVDALFSNTIGSFNTGNGVDALFSNTDGYYNTATGVDALFYNTTGYYNTATGDSALLSNTTGNDNIAVGHQAGFNLTTGSNNIDIGNQGVAGESNTIRIGTQGTQTATFIAGIRGTPIAGGVAVGVSSSGQLGVRASSVRFKEGINPMEKASEAILALKPVTFHYKKELDPDRIPQFGLVAEDVEKINPDLVVRDSEGKPYTVRYEAVNAMLLNEFLKAHRRIEEQDKRIEQLTAQLKEQAEQIRRVNDKVEMNRAAPQVVVNAARESRE